MVHAETLLAAVRTSKTGFQNPGDLHACIRAHLSLLPAADPRSTALFFALERLFSLDAGDAPGTVPTNSLSADVFLQNFRNFRPYLPGRGPGPRAAPSLLTLGPDYDFIARSEPVSRWSPAKCVNFALTLAVPQTRKAGIVSSVRNEGIGILEWIAHHRAMGFEGIFLYTNNNTDGSTPLLRRLAEAGVIVLIENEVGADTAPQKKGFEHSLHFLPAVKAFEWLFYLDADEFFIPFTGEDYHIGSFFADFGRHFPDNQPSSILFNWKWFGSENVFERTKGLVLDRFLYSKPNGHVKFLAKSKDIISAANLHIPVLLGSSRQIDAGFADAKVEGVEVAPVYEKGQLNHYWNKSFQEYVLKKLRGRGAVGTSEAQRGFDNFFDWGANTIRGSLDRPPAPLRDRTERMYRDLLSIGGVAEGLAEVERRFIEQLAEADARHDLRKLYAARGRIAA